MTAFNPSDIPTDISTYEQLAVWLGQVFLHLHAETQVQVSGRNYDIVAQGGVYQGMIPGDPDNTPWYFTLRLNLPLLRDWLAYSDPWDAAQELDTATIPARLKS